MTIVAVFATLVALMLVGLPIAIAMALTGTLIMLLMGGPDMLVMLAQRMYSATTSFPLLAIPFFILAGNLMNTGGMTHRIFNFTQLLVGRVRGGLAMVAVVAEILFSGISGSTTRTCRRSVRYSFPRCDAPVTAELNRSASLPPPLRWAFSFRRA